jgi:hypothetical protein
MHAEKKTQKLGISLFHEKLRLVSEKTVDS